MGQSGELKRCSGKRLRLVRPKHRSGKRQKLRQQRVLGEEVGRFAERHDQPGYNVIPAQVCELVFQGDSLLLQVEIADGRRIALRRPTTGHGTQAALQPGASIHVALPVQDTLIVPRDHDA